MSNVGGTNYILYLNPLKDEDMGKTFTKVIVSALIQQFVLGP